jgi:DNA-binding LacI/PurR family transcriptional regulator
MITLREVAKKAGVSVSTVSSVLNGQAAQARISSSTAARVAEAAQHLGYHHNALAKSLRTGRSNVIGMIAHSFPAHRTQMTQTAARALIDQGYQVALKDITWWPDDEAKLVTELLSQRIDGLFLQSNTYPESGYEGHEAYQVLLNLARSGFPMVRVDGAKGLPIDTVVLDREYGAYMATSHLLELGHRRIAYSLSRENTAPKCLARMRGYDRAYREWGLPVDKKLFIDLPDDLAEQSAYAGGYQTMQALLENHIEATALIATNDQVAIGALCAAHHMGVRVPDDLAIIGFTGSEEGRYAMVPLTTVVFPWEAMAREAAGLLQERLEGFKKKPRSLTLTPELVIRRSCGANTQYIPAAEAVISN